MDVLTHIIDEHKKFRKLMSKIESAKGDKKDDLFRTLFADLSGLSKAEEHVVFPLVKDNLRDADVYVVLEMIEEHSLGKYQFSVLERTSVENETWDAKFSVLKEVLEYHMEEEEKEFIPLAKKSVSKEELSAISKKFETVLERYKMAKKEKLGI